MYHLHLLIATLWQAVSANLSGDTRLEHRKLLRGGTSKHTERKLLPSFIWHPYLIFDEFTRHGSLGDRGPSITVLWRATSSSCDICWSTASCSPSTSVSPISGGLISDFFQYAITGLLPAQKYNYKVQCGSETLDGSFHTPPAIPTSASPEVSTKVLAYGDSRDDLSIHNRIAEQMMYETSGGSTESDWFGALALHTGDFVYDGECLEHWNDDIMNTGYARLRELMSNTPMNGCRGNHENYHSSSYGCSPHVLPWHSLFPNVFPYPFVDFATNETASPGTTPSALTYSFDYGAIHVTSIDQYTEPDGTYDRTSTSYGYCGGAGCTSCSPHYNWLQQDLEGANSRDVKPFLFVLIHEPMYSAGGGHSNENETCFEKLMEDQGVDVVVLAGHNHYYARAEKKNPNAAYKGKKIYHITTGGGCCLYSPNNPIDDPGYPHVRKAVERNHYCRIDANTYGTTYDDRFLCFEAVDIDGEQIDFFEIGPSRPSGYDYCTCTSPIACSDSRLCNGEERCDSGECQPADFPGSWPCGAGTLCIEERSGVKCGCESLSSRDCKDYAPYCEPPTSGGKIKCRSTGDYPAGPENTAAKCDDGVDNDFDGLIDCDDPDCALFCDGSSAPIPPATTSTSATSVSTGTTSMGSTTATTAASSSTSAQALTTSTAQGATTTPASTAILATQASTTTQVLPTTTAQACSDKDRVACKEDSSCKWKGTCVDRYPFQ